MPGFFPDVGNITFNIFADFDQPSVVPLGRLHHIRDTADQKGCAVGRRRGAEIGIVPVLGTDQKFALPGANGIETPVSRPLVAKNPLQGPGGKRDDGGMHLAFHILGALP